MCPKLQSGQLVDREMADAGTLRPVAKGLTAGRLNGRFGLMAQGRREDGEGHVEERRVRGSEVAEIRARRPPSADREDTELRGGAQVPGEHRLSCS